jgi:hypothetical protein
MCSYPACDYMNYWAIVVASIAYFMIGALWYSPVLFSKAWVEESKVKPDPSKSLAKLLIGTFIITAFMVYLLAYLIAATGSFSALGGLRMGFITGIGFVATTLGITFLYEGRSLKLFLIDAGYHIAGLLVSGLIIGMWH